MYRKIKSKALSPLYLFGHIGISSFLSLVRKVMWHQICGIICMCDVASIYVFYPIKKIEKKRLEYVWRYEWGKLKENAATTEEIKKD